MQGTAGLKALNYECTVSAEEQRCVVWLEDGVCGDNQFRNV